jgi:acylphosphatase
MPPTSPPPERPTVTRRLLIGGRVQGVCYRAWSERNARELGLSGWVRNLASGQVQMLCRGPLESVETLVARCRVGPPAAVVDSVQVEESQAIPPAGFVQRRTA